MSMSATQGDGGGGTGIDLVPSLRSRFTSQWHRALIPGASSDPDAVFDIVYRYYAEPHRSYHNERHLAHCLQHLDTATGQIAQPDRVEMALWFHDIINEPGRLDNEARSAELFRDLAADVMPKDFVAAVIDLILVTTHRDPPEDRDQRFICDIDLVSFGCPWERYLHDSANLKAEFPGPEDEYRWKKRAFLETVLNRPRIFLTDFFHERYEGRARENIPRLIDLINRRQD